MVILKTLFNDYVRCFLLYWVSQMRVSIWFSRCVKAANLIFQLLGTCQWNYKKWSILFGVYLIQWRNIPNYDRQMGFYFNRNLSFWSVIQEVTLIEKCYLYRASKSYLKRMKHFDKFQALYRLSETTFCSIQGVY